MHFQFKRFLYFVYFLHIQRIFSTEKLFCLFPFKQCVNNCLFVEEENILLDPKHFVNNFPFDITDA